MIVGVYSASFPLFSFALHIFYFFPFLFLFLFFCVFLQEGGNLSMGKVQLPDIFTKEL